MKECDKRNSHTSRKLHVTYVSSNNVRHPVTKTFTTLHPTTLHSTSLRLSTLHFLHLNFTHLHFTTLSLGMYEINLYSQLYTNKTYSPDVGKFPACFGTSYLPSPAVWLCYSQWTISRTLWWLLWWFADGGTCDVPKHVGDLRTAGEYT